MRNLAKCLAVLLTVAMILSLGGAAFASGEASGEIERDIQPWPSLQSHVYTTNESVAQAAFVCYGLFDEIGDIVPFTASSVEVTLYDTREDGTALGVTYATYDASKGGWTFNVPLPAENTVWWASFDGSLTAPIYIVVHQAETTQTLYNKAIASGNTVAFTLNRTEDGNTGDMYVNGVLVEGAGVHELVGVVITVIE